MVGITNSQCARAYGFAQVSSGTMCASTEDGRGSCHVKTVYQFTVVFVFNACLPLQSDSGGPLSVVENGVFTQVGVVSFGSADGCEAGYPVGFARLSSFTEWISTVTGITL